MWIGLPNGHPAMAPETPAVLAVYHKEEVVGLIGNFDPKGSPTGGNKV